jgi:hypothetical protein
VSLEALLDQQVDLVSVTDVLHEYLDCALVDAAYEDLRNGERERAWTLKHMVEFWTAVILRAPPSLSHALRRACGGRASGYPHVDASPQAFFKRSSSLRWEFFAEVFRGFVERVTKHEPGQFARHHRDVAERFGRLLVIDGSNLDPVARRLKILWKQPEAPIPGSIFACYDLLRGTLADLRYTHTLRKGELTLAREALAHLPAGSLLIGDRLFGTPKFLADVQESGLFGVFRRQNWAKVAKEEFLGHTEIDESAIEDWRVVIGDRARQPARLIRVTRGEDRYEFITNVLDPEQLPALDISELYRDRWEVERMFHDLKRVLNLHCFYCGNTNAIAMQLYASAIVYTAMRIAQGRIAVEAEIEPEWISEAKLFPLLAAASATVTILEAGFLMTERANPGVELNKPDWRHACSLQIRLGDILADKTRGTRPREPMPSPKKRRFWREMPPPKEPPGAHA